jgi:ADP-heptose:LPS heptosyltransferase
MKSVHDSETFVFHGETLERSLTRLQGCLAYFGGDTGMMHVAAAFKKPIVSLWGNTSPEMGMFPYYGFNNLKERVAPESVIMEMKKLSCHPCSKLGYNRCPKGHFKCMKNLDMAVAVEEVKRLWSGVVGKN